MNSPNEDRHWADQVATKILESGRPLHISTGISPSGHIHIGNMREVLTGDAIYRVLRERGAEVRFNFIADNFDPLRKVYEFLDPKLYESLVGRPLSEIPCPCGGHESYAEHFLEPFTEALAELHIEAEVERSDQMYKSGRMSPYIARALEERDRIAGILQELTGKQMPQEWSPFSPLCPDCARISQARVTGFSTADQTVDYSCGCGAAGTLPMAGGGKLVWRIDWAARWAMLGVTVEPFGKDHSTRGGSYDTGVRIAREVFDHEAPFPIPYEWIRLKGQGDMSSSKGNVLSIGEVLTVAPPEVLRYLVVRERPQKTINFSPALPLLQLVDEFDDSGAKNRDERAIELSLAGGGFEAVGVPYKHLVVVLQAARFDEEKAMQILRRGGYEGLSTSAAARRMAYARRWLDTFAPEDLKFTVQDELPTVTAELNGDQRRFLALLAAKLESGMDGEVIHKLIYSLAEEFSGVKPALLFQAIYLSLLGKPRGPRAGWFLSLLGPAFCAARFKEASEVLDEA